MTLRSLLRALTLSATLALVLGSIAAAQVATLRTPGPDAEASAPPAEALDGEEAILAFVACLRDNGVDLPDPQFGADGVRFADPAIIARIDFRSSDFLDAVEACQDLLAALQPEVDPEQQAEQVELLLAFSECMRREGVDMPDPDPISGYSIGALRGPDGELAIDPFSADFIAASATCQAELDVAGAPGPGDDGS
jgi:hypothetical protein